jgi:branched-chain amino acid transport system permease protein
MNRFLRRAVITGLVAGGAALHVSAVGIVATFQRKPIIHELISMGTALPPLIAFMAGWFAGGQWRSGARERPAPAIALASGAIAGAVMSVLLAALTLLPEVIEVRAMFQSVTPALIDILRFGQDATVGSILLVGLGAVSGLAGAALRVIPGSIARALIMALIVTLAAALMERFVNQILTRVPLIDVLSDFLFRRGGLTIVGAIALFVAVAAVTYLWLQRGTAVRAAVAARPVEQRRNLKLGAIVLAVVILALLPQFIGGFLSETLVVIGTFVLLGLGLNIVVGYAGLLDLGYVAFYAVGAYVLASLTSPIATAVLTTGVQFNFWTAMPFVMVAAALAGLMVGAPVLRLRGDYLAIVTLGFGEIARIVLGSDWMKPYVGGAQGITQIPAANLFGITFRQPESLYYLVLALCIGAALAAISLANSRIGRAWNAMREDEVVAEATGINTHKYKLLAFVLGAVFGCLAGAVFAVRIGSVFPHSFELLVSINALALIILGGMGSIPGVIVGAIVLVGLPELLREFADFRLLFYGAILIAMMILKPEGLLPSRARQAELHEREDLEDQFAERAGEETGAPVVTA